MKIHKKSLKTSQRGFSHLLPLLIVLVFAVAGVYFLVASKAEQSGVVDPWDLGINLDNPKPGGTQPPQLLPPPDGASAGAASNGNRKETLFSGNWAGLGVQSNKVSDVTGEIIVPATKCRADGRATTYWVGIGGGFSGRTVQQTGFDSVCYKQGGQLVATYFAWWEMYKPNGDRQGNYKMQIRPGDHIVASVHHSSGKYYVQLKNKTTGAHAGHTADCSNCDRSSAEWIVERMGFADGQHGLMQFKPVTFKNLALADEASNGRYVPLYKRPYHPYALLNASGKKTLVKTKLPNTDKVKTFKGVFVSSY